MAAGKTRTLLAFDFDHTLIAENSDITVTQLAPEGRLPEEIQDKYSSQGWTEYMGMVFQFLHGHGITASQLQDCMHHIPLTQGMQELMDFVKQNRDKYDMIIISDSNSVFIDYCLENFGLKDSFQRVFTNPAQYNSQGCLTIQYYHSQDWCELSTVNLCKGHILQEYIKSRQGEGVSYSTVIYVGDGSNDLCPGLTLSSTDFLCPRVGFTLLRKVEKLKGKEEKRRAKEERRRAKEQRKVEERLEPPEERVKPPGELHPEEAGQSSKDNGRVLRAKVLPWQSGQDLLRLLQDLQSGKNVPSAFQ